MATWSYWSYLILALPLFFSGCMGTAAVVEAMGKDPASVCVQLTTIYGKAQIARSNIQGGKVFCSAEGLTVDSKVK